MRPFRYLACLLGMHGPDWCGFLPHWKSQRLHPFLRRCGDCGAEWEGREGLRDNTRTTVWRRK